ncbi:efflux RND transporter periplasmic adaptor subunit [Desulfoprunum benzoelyticum]|uniref:RND family efflux transporter MFP subunit n=1 Tax=Desulfoprunum benzoelyticum TaxID=1506996 RepID=A0A840UVE9_9BACT|nr:efflux RND transporter periplasmic adaptor subunit [Desulfoprunum benzoelyticum]MBB5349762.1 RND family efflux transporter MFP subunit [Desulfoprunum benzoelyticum]MBM9531896.1 efflux RND transporter periplasmic adaptor subunit [Desulfoprunum benzoelyticum]
MKRFPIQRRTLVMLAGFVPLIALFVYVALRSGALAPVPVTVAKVENRSIAPALFGIGTVEARYTYRIGPTFTGRVKSLDVEVGDQVEAGQVLGEMDPIDLDERIRALEAALKRTAAQIDEAQIRHGYAQTQARRYQRLLEAQTTSEEIAGAKTNEYQVAEASLKAARAESVRVEAELEALVAQRRNLVLLAPAAGLVAARHADPGATIVAGQAVVDLIDPHQLWINVRFDQINAHGLAADLPAHIVLRSQAAESRAGRVLRVEPLADAVTEETLAKAVFDELPQPLPPLGELAEVTVDLPPLAAGPVVPNAAIQRLDGQLGVWRVSDGDLRFTPVTMGVADLDGYVQVRDGLEVDDEIVVYSANTLHPRSRIRVVQHLTEVKP